MKELRKKLIEIHESLMDHCDEMEKIPQVKEPDKLDRPEKGEHYWHVTPNDRLDNIVWVNDNYDNHQLLQGNCFWGDDAQQRCKEYQAEGQYQILTDWRIGDMGRDH